MPFGKRNKHFHDQDSNFLELWLEQKYDKTRVVKINALTGQQKCIRSCSTPCTCTFTECPKSVRKYACVSLYVFYIKRNTSHKEAFFCYQWNFKTASLGDRSLRRSAVRLATCRADDSFSAPMRRIAAGRGTMRRCMMAMTTVRVRRRSMQFIYENALQLSDSLGIVRTVAILEIVAREQVQETHVRWAPGPSDHAFQTGRCDGNGRLFSHSETPGIIHQTGAAPSPCGMASNMGRYLIAQKACKETLSLSPYQLEECSRMSSAIINSRLLVDPRKGSMIPLDPTRVHATSRVPWVRWQKPQLDTWSRSISRRKGRPDPGSQWISR